MKPAYFKILGKGKFAAGNECPKCGLENVYFD